MLASVATIKTHNGGHTWYMEVSLPPGTFTQSTILGIPLEAGNSTIDMQKNSYLADTPPVVSTAQVFQ